MNLVYPQSGVHLAFLEEKLRAWIDAANDAHRRKLERQKAERAKLAQLEKTRQVANVEIDTAFSRWPSDEQEAWLRERLGLEEAVPAFLSRQSYPQTVIQVQAFLFQANIFERFIHGSRQGTRLTANAIYPCLRRRFKLPAHNCALQRLAINMYLRYLAVSRFLDEAGTDMTGPYYVTHSVVSLPTFTSFETRYDGERLLSEQARGTGPRRRWRVTRPRWRSVRDDAHEMLAGSPYRDLLLDALDSLSMTNRSSSPHHWAEPLVAQGVPLEYCFELLSVAGLIER